MDLKNLSKYKYIYRIYESSDEVLHCEKYPVIYINNKVVYFKDARKQERLNYKDVNKILDNFTKFYQGENAWKWEWGRPCFDEYFWNVETNITEIYEDLKKQRFAMRCKKIERSKYDRLERAKKEYENALKEVEAFEKLRKDLGCK